MSTIDPVVSTDHVRILGRLTLPAEGRLEVVLDTDAYNEVDDQFAIVYALRSVERLNVNAIYAAPFHNERSNGPADGMRRSLDEIRCVLELAGHPDTPSLAGSTSFLESSERPVESDATADLINRAFSCAGPLYVLAIGAITNVASALLIEPRLRERIVVVWLGGHAIHWPDTAEFNLKQDPIAARTVFDCGVPLVHIPCLPVASHLVTTIEQLQERISGRTPIGTYLTDAVREHLRTHSQSSKVIWDVATIAYMVHSGWVGTHVVSSPVLSSGFRWCIDNRRHPVRMAFSVDRDRIFTDLFAGINGFETDDGG